MATWRFVASATEWREESAQWHRENQKSSKAEVQLVKWGTSSYKKGHKPSTASSGCSCPRCCARWAKSTLASITIQVRPELSKS